MEILSRLLDLPDPAGPVVVVAGANIDLESPRDAKESRAGDTLLQLLSAWGYALVNCAEPTHRDRRGDRRFDFCRHARYLP
eukprot:3638855-Lingulodinium_polyedra.AAC.1